MVNFSLKGCGSPGNYSGTLDPVCFQNSSLINDFFQHKKTKTGFDEWISKMHFRMTYYGQKAYLIADRSQMFAAYPVAREEPL